MCIFRMKLLLRVKSKDSDLLQGDSGPMAPKGN